MNFDFMDTQSQVFFMRMLLSCVVLAFSICLYLTSRAIDHPRIMGLFWRGAVLMGVFFISRILAGVLDNIFAFNLGWFSNLVNIVFWGYLTKKAYSVYTIMDSPKISSARTQLRSDIDAFIERLEAAKSSVDNLLEPSRK